MKPEMKFPENPEYKIVALDAHTWVIDEGGVRFFLLEGEEKALLIDSGMMIRNARDIASGLTKLPIALLNTHADGDHVGSNAQFDWFYMSLAEASNYYNDFKGEGRIEPVAQGDVLDLGNRRLEIIALPGHTPGSIGVLEIETGRFYSGDPIQSHGMIFLFDPRREIHAYVQSLKQLLERAVDIKEIYPSHGDYPLGMDAVDRCIAMGEEILAGTAPGEKILFFDRDEVMKYENDFTTILYDVSY